VKSSHITVSDFFCGAGGSSQGVRRLAERNNGGIEVKLAMNHWKLAIETHNTNFPDTTHVCTDISACDPRRYYRTTIAVMSPECTTRSPAGGNRHKSEKKAMELFDSGKIDPATERSRATMWDVPRFAEYHQYEAIIVENVVEAKTTWNLFDNWLGTMHTLGYDHKCCYLNSMHFFPTPQSRDRMYIVFWKKGNKAPKLDYTPAAFCVKCGKDVHAIQSFKNPAKKYGKYGIKNGQYVYRCPVHGSIVEPYYYAAFNCIDWTDLGQRIGDREKPLAPNTNKRINYGLDKFGPQSMVLHSTYSDQARGVIRSAVENPLFTQTTFESQAVLNPFLINDKHTTGIDFRVKHSRDVVNTVDCDPRIKLITPPIIVQSEQSSNLKNAVSVNDVLHTHATRQTMAVCTPPAFIIDGNYDAKPSRASSISEVMVTRNTHQRDSLITWPLVVDNQNHQYSNPATSTIPAQTTVGKTGIVTTEALNSFFTAYHNGAHNVRHFTESIPTIPTKDSVSIVNYQTPKIEDCYYRMLKPGEIKLAMAFDKQYVILGSGKDQVKQCGNAVTPPVMEWLVQQVVESLEGAA
jgi:DNA (cytosine-5)-methyltransferase 1